MSIHWFLRLVCVGMMLWPLGCSSGSDSNTASDAISTNDTPAPPAGQCSDYCELIVTRCTGMQTLDFGQSSCSNVCTTFAAGEPGATSGNSLECRLTYLKDELLPSDQVCAAASPPGGSPETGFFCADSGETHGCLSDEDNRGLETADPWVVGAGCNEQCLDSSNADCVLDCISEAASISKGCAECVFVLVSCAKEQCAVDCGDASNSPTCEACRADKCNDGFDACSGKKPPETGPQCGNSQCEPGEDKTCPEDCNGSSTCGNDQCDGFESQEICPSDCNPDAASCAGECGSFQGSAPCHCDALCEESNNCCTDYWELCSGTGPSCGNGQCDPDETEETCPNDCGCGNGMCEESETHQSCPADCESEEAVCGNGKCEEGENDQNCLADCEGVQSVCGNDECEEDENDQSCPADCKPEPSVCGNGECEEDENDEKCPEDCKAE